MTTPNRRTVLAILATTAALWLPSAQAQTKEISFGFISTEASTNLKAAWQPMLDDLQKATGIKVKAFFATDYAGVIEAMRFNKVQVGWFGNKSAIEAVDRSNGEVFAKVVAKDGTEGYYSLLVVNKDSALKSLDDVVKQHASLTLGFGDPNSTSGTVIPGYYAFGRNHVDPLKGFKRTVRANHETNLLAVVNKQVDVATNNTENWDRFAITHPEQIKEVREIWRSPIIPSDPLVWRKDLDAATKQKVREFLLGYGKQPREKAILEKLGYSAFRASSDTQLITIRQIELAKARNAAEADTSLSADEKAKKLHEIDDKLSELGKQVASAK
jgi:phosphonate transport system substrate-binding protein